MEVDTPAAQHGVTPSMVFSQLLLPVTTGLLPVVNQPPHTRLPKRKQPEVDEAQCDTDINCLPDLDSSPLHKTSRPTPESLIAIPVDRLVKVQFSEGILVDGKILYREPFGLQVTIIGHADAVDAPIGSRWWAKTTNLFAPGTSFRIVQAIHPTC